MHGLKVYEAGTVIGGSGGMGKEFAGIGIAVSSPRTILYMRLTIHRLQSRLLAGHHHTGDFIIRIRMQWSNWHLHGIKVVIHRSQVPVFAEQWAPLHTGLWRATYTCKRQEAKTLFGCEGNHGLAESNSSLPPGL